MSMDEFEIERFTKGRIQRHERFEAAVRAFWQALNIPGMGFSGDTLDLIKKYKNVPKKSVWLLTVCKCGEHLTVPVVSMADLEHERKALRQMYHTVTIECTGCPRRWVIELGGVQGEGRY